MASSSVAIASLRRMEPRVALACVFVAVLHFGLMENLTETPLRREYTSDEQPHWRPSPSESYETACPPPRVSSQFLKVEPERLDSFKLAPLVPLNCIRFRQARYLTVS